MGAFAWIVGGTVALVVGMEIFSAKPAASGGGSGGSKGDRFSVMRDILPEGTEKSISSFSPGDHIVVSLRDSKLNITIPNVILRVQTVGKDGMQTIFDSGLNKPPAGSIFTTVEYPPDGARFAVFPRDVLASAPKDHGDALHTLTAEDVAAGPALFAPTVGFSTVEDLLKANPAVFTTSPVPLTGDFATDAPLYGQPGVYTSSAPIPVVMKLSPWIVGTIVRGLDTALTKTTITTGPATSFAGEFGSVPYGGNGYGSY